MQLQATILLNKAVSIPVTRLMEYFAFKIRAGVAPNRVETSRLIDWLVQLTERSFTRRNMQVLGAIGRG
jgi:hypothetical protein